MTGARWWWLSFCDPDLPKGERFVGVTVVQAGDVIAAVRRAHVLGINPGGEVAFVEIRDADLVPAPENCERLLLGSDARELAASVDRKFRERRRNDDLR